MKNMLQPLTGVTLRHLLFVLVCLILLSVGYTAKIITDDISSVLEHQLTLRAADL